MKFAIAVVLLAVALGAEASVVAWGPWGHGALGAGTWDGRSWNSAWDQGDWAGRGAWDQGDWAGRGAWDDGQWNEGAWGDRGAWAGHGAWGGPVAVAGHAAVVPAVPAWGHEGSYVAKTRGAVHVAPLSGHANSATSINVQPAPGTV